MNYKGYGKPDFLLPGFPKCGTTWLYHRLNELPDFDMPPHKELHFFSRENKYSNGEAGKTYNKFFNRKRLIRNFKISGLNFFRIFIRFYESNDITYLKLFNKFEGLTGDITPTYAMISDEVVKKMSEFLPDVKLIFVIRDPIERAWSQFRMHLREQNQSLENYGLNETLNFLKDDLQIRRGKYLQSIDRYTNFFQNSPIILIYYDLLKEDPNCFLKILVSFLGGNPNSVKKLSTLNKKSNVSVKEKMPKQIFDHLKDQYFSEIKNLANRYEGYSRSWYKKYYNTSEDREENISLNKYLILN